MSTTIQPLLGASSRALASRPTGGNSLRAPRRRLPQSAAAPSVPATDVYHGVTVTDPYRNLEDLKNPKTREWLLAQGEFTAQLLGRIEGRDALYERIAALSALLQPPAVRNSRTILATVCGSSRCGT